MTFKTLDAATLKVKATDSQFYEETITEVSDDGDRYDINCGGGHLCIPKKPGIVPKKGDIARFYGKGFGYMVRGVDVAGQTVYYRSEKQSEDDRKKQVALDKAKRKKEYLKSAPETHKRVDALPNEFKDRINYFRSRNPDWKYEFEGYELFTCEQAVAISTRLKTTEDISSWTKLPFEEQKKIVPELSDGHSGNSFGMAARLAALYWSEPELIVKMHGAMCGLCGCEDYGCWASGPEAKAIKEKTKYETA